jgi:hypothetical protein
MRGLADVDFALAIRRRGVRQAAASRVRAMATGLPFDTPARGSREVVSVVVLGHHGAITRTGRTLTGAEHATVSCSTGSNSSRGFKIDAHVFNKPSVRFGSQAGVIGADRSRCWHRATKLLCGFGEPCRSMAAYPNIFLFCHAGILGIVMNFRTCVNEASKDKTDGPPSDYLQLALRGTARRSFFARI